MSENEDPQTTDCLLSTKIKHLHEIYWGGVPHFGTQPTWEWRGMAATGQKNPLTEYKLEVGRGRKISCVTWRIYICFFDDDDDDDG